MRRLGEFALLFFAFCLAGQAAQVICAVGPGLRDHPLALISSAVLVGFMLVAGARSWVQRLRAKRMMECESKYSHVPLLRRSSREMIEDLENFWATLSSWGSGDTLPYLTSEAPNKRIEHTPPRRRGSSA